VSVAVIDGGGANLGSVLAALARLNADAIVTTDAATIRQATHVILPGVGAAGPAMARLRETALDRLIPALTQPVLGICLGMQLMYEGSEEGDTECLRLVPGVVTQLQPAPGVRIPHMGWNRLIALRESPLLAGLDPTGYAYFVHGYAAPLSSDTLAATEHGTMFTAVVAHRNFHGFQFHPERSAAVGAGLLRNFLAL
jgi:glutamine amidotransferase